MNLQFNGSVIMFSSMPTGLNRFDKVFYINLEHRQDRNQQILSELQKLEVDPKKIVRIDAYRDILNGHRGCALSHIKALKLALEMDLEEVVILEDDAFFLTDTSELEAHLSHFFMHVNAYDILLLGSRVELFQESNITGIHRARRARLAHAYVVRKHYIPKLLAVYEATYKRLLSIPLAKEAHDCVIDRAWDPLFEQDRILFTKIFAYQRGGYSDIQHFNHPAIEDILS
jgi:hypothetical protein